MVAFVAARVSNNTYNLSVNALPEIARVQGFSAPIFDQQNLEPVGTDETLCHGWPARIFFPAQVSVCVNVFVPIFGGELEDQKTPRPRPFFWLLVYFKTTASPNFSTPTLWSGSNAHVLRFPVSVRKLHEAEPASVSPEVRGALRGSGAGHRGLRGIAARPRGPVARVGPAASVGLTS